ncbi:MAG: hypothetical protein ACOCRO_11285 [Halanaerobiales bacterium]
MNCFALETIYDNNDIPLGQKPLQIKLRSEIINLIKKQYISEIEFKILKKAMPEVSYIAIGNDMYQVKLSNNKLEKIPAELFTAEEGFYHIVLEQELKDKNDFIGVDNKDMSNDYRSCFVRAGSYQVLH